MRKKKRRKKKRIFNMRKKESPNTIVTILIIIILISFVWSYNLLGIRMIINEGIDKIQGLSLNLNVNIGCPKGVIPSELNLLTYDGDLTGYRINNFGGLEAPINPKWLDGQEITPYPPTPEGNLFTIRTHCVKGSEKGQNTNQYYCDVGYSKTTTDISEEGNIGKTKTISYNIKLVLEEKELIQTIKGIPIKKYSIIDSTCLKT